MLIFAQKNKTKKKTKKRIPSINNFYTARKEAQGLDRVLIDYKLPSVRAQILSDTLLLVPIFPMSAGDSNYLKI